MFAAQHWHSLPPAVRQVPYRNIRQLLSLHASATPEKTWLIAYDADGQRSEYTYARFNALVHQAAGYLYDDLGVRRGDRVATMLTNSPEAAVIYFTCWLIGAAVVPQNTAEDDRRIAHILRSSGAVVCLASDEWLPRAARLISSADDGLGAPNIRQLVQVGGTPSPDVPHFASEIAHRPDTFMSTDEAVALDDDALLVYTSGTTGAPKGVVLTQYNLLVDAAGIAAANAITGNQRMMNVLPLHHVNGIVVTLMTPLYAGGSVVLNRAYSSSVFWRRIATERVHVVSVVPTLLQFSLDFADKQAVRGASIWGDDVGRYDLRHFRHFICGAGTLSVRLAKAFEDRFGLPIVHGYGLSETTCYSCFLPLDLRWNERQHWLLEYGYPSIGCAITPNEMAIFDAAGQGVQLGPGERGEICVRGHNVMRGYDARPEANADAFAFGWFRTGDEGFYEVDAQGRAFFFITGRLKELINRGGIKFSPFDIEEVLLAFPGVKVGLAVGFPNDYYGEEVGAYIVPVDGVTLDIEALLAHCRARMPFGKSPKVVVFGSEIPVTSTGKYQRLKLRDLFSAWEHTQFRPESG
jgi:long-chain acyl-CoA synthetase